MGIEDSDLLDIDIGGDEPDSPPPSEQIISRLDQLVSDINDLKASQQATASAVATLAEQNGTALGDGDVSTFQFPLVATVPPQTPEIDPIVAAFDAPFDGTITQVVPRFPDGVLDAAGVGLFDSDDNRILPRGGEFNFAEQDGDGRDRGTPTRLTGGDVTYPAATLNVSVSQGDTITAKFSNNDPEFDHLIALLVYVEEAA